MLRWFAAVLLVLGWLPGLDVPGHGAPVADLEASVMWADAASRADASPTHDDPPELLGSPSLEIPNAGLRALRAGYEPTSPAVPAAHQRPLARAPPVLLPIRT